MTTRQNIISLTLLIFAVSCNSPTNTNISTKKSLDSSQTNDSFLIISDTIKCIWLYDYATEIPVRHTKVNPDTLTPKKLLDIINNYCGQNKIILDLVKVSNDTIYVTIINSTYLTQSIGTTGADDYISTTVYTLTELKSIKYVNFDFEEGDHAQPGTYGRQYYIDRIKTTIIHK